MSSEILAGGEKPSAATALWRVVEPPGDSRSNGPARKDAEREAQGLEQARREGFAAGVTAGRREAEEQIRPAMDGLARNLAELARLRDKGHLDMVSDTESGYFPNGSALCRLKHIPWTPFALAGSQFKLIAVDWARDMYVFMLVVCLVASVLCADFIGFGDNVLAIRPFMMLGNVVILNNMASALILSPFILAAVYPRVERGRMLYKDVMPELKTAPRARSIAGLILLIAGEAGAWASGNLLSMGYWVPKFLSPWMAAAPYDKAIAVISGPCIIVALIGMAML